VNEPGAVVGCRNRQLNQECTFVMLVESGAVIGNVVGLQKLLMMVVNADDAGLQMKAFLLQKLMVSYEFKVGQINTLEVLSVLSASIIVSRRCRAPMECLALK